MHRLGQSKEVKVNRLIASSSIEEKILALQERKQLIFNGTIGGSNAALGKLTEDDLKFLFGTN